MKYPKRSQYKHAKSQYRVRNWSEYEAGMKKRGDLTVLLSDAALDVQLASKILNTMTSLGMTASHRMV